MLSMTDWAFSWPISGNVSGCGRPKAQLWGGREGMREREVEVEVEGTHAGSSRRRCGGGFGRCCVPCARSSSRASGRRRSSRLQDIVS